jgi:hypothetical protein
LMKVNCSKNAKKRQLQTLLGRIQTTRDNTESMSTVHENLEHKREFSLGNWLRNSNGHKDYSTMGIISRLDRYLVTLNIQALTKTRSA